MGVKEILTRRVGRLPVWVWLAGLSAGVGIGLYLRRRSSQNEEEEDAVEEQSYADVYGNEMLEYGSGTGTGGIVLSGVGGTASYEELYQDWLESQFSEVDFAGTFSDAVSDWLANQEALGLIPAAGGPPPAPATQTTPPPSGAASRAPPAHSTSRAVAHRPSKPAHYHPGGNVSNKSGSVKRHFPGATGWIEINTPDNRFADFHIAYANGRLDRWRGWGTGSHVPKGKRGKWEKIASVKWG